MIKKMFGAALLFSLQGCVMFGVEKMEPPGPPHEKKFVMFMKMRHSFLIERGENDGKTGRRELFRFF